MSRHTHDQIVDALRIAEYLDSEDINYILPVPLVYLLYKSIRTGTVTTEQVLAALLGHPESVYKFLRNCGDDEIEPVMKYIEEIENSNGKMYGLNGLKIMKAWAARQNGAL